MWSGPQHCLPCPVGPSQLPFSPLAGTLTSQPVSIPGLASFPVRVTLGLATCLSCPQAPPAGGSMDRPG